METVLAQLRELSRKFGSLSTNLRLLIAGGVLAAIVVVVVTGMNNAAGTYQYAFTNLSNEDSSEAAAHLKAANVPFRLEAGGTALAVPASHVYDARLLLAAAGLPRAGGVGFEIFDRGDLGVSEFTQKVNLRRALEGELARTIGRLAAIRSARVHITLSDKGLYRDEDRKASAAVVVNLQPGRTLADRELAGVRHLVASAVPGLDAEAVILVDGRGSVLAGSESPGAKAAGEQRDMEKRLEGRIVELLEPAVGAGAVVAKVTATLDNSEVESTADTFDPESSVVRSERKTAEKTAQDSAGPSGVAGAAANQPLSPTPAASVSNNRGSMNREDEVRNFEISKTITRSVTRGPRLKRLSIAVLIDGVNGKARSAADVARLAELAKSAVGFDTVRGDRFDLSSEPFTHVEDPSLLETPSLFASPKVRYGLMAGAGLLLLLVVGFAVVQMRRRKSALANAETVALLQPGSRISDLEAAITRAESLPALPATPALPELPDPMIEIRERARRLVDSDPARVARLLRAWIDADQDVQREAA